MARGLTLALKWCILNLPVKGVSTFPLKLEGDRNKHMHNGVSL